MTLKVSYISEKTFEAKKVYKQNKKKTTAFIKKATKSNGNYS